MQYITFDEATKLQFSGHETFPLRYGWLKKVYDAVYSTPPNTAGEQRVFTPEEAIVRFGVGKNMVASMRYWALAVGIIEAERVSSGPYYLTPLAKTVFDDKGCDPWMEHPDTFWLVHWKLASTPDRTTTWYWVFNHCPHISFDRALLLEHLSRICHERGLKKIAQATIKRDIEVFARTYLPRSETKFRDDTMECPLAELNLIEPTGQKEGMRLVKGPKPTLTAGFFSFATIDYWQRHFGNVATLSFDSLLHATGSPGRVFQLDESSLLDLAVQVENITDGAIMWSETAGLKQLVLRNNELPGLLNPEDYLCHQETHAELDVA